MILSSLYGDVLKPIPIFADCWWLPATRFLCFNALSCVPRWQGRPLEHFKSHFPSTKFLLSPFPPTYFAVAWEARRTCFSPPFAATPNIPSLDETSLVFTTNHVFLSPVLPSKSVRTPEHVAPLTPVTSNPKATLVVHAHGT